MLHIVQTQSLDLPSTAETFLDQLPGPTVLEWRKPGCSDWCVVSTLVHGNEPSGFMASFELLQSGFCPAINTALVIASVEAARADPRFYHRALPGAYDLNRRFGRAGDDPVTALAIDIATYIRERQPLWLVDIHNTSGRGPAFAVSMSDAPAVRQLANAFTDHMIITHLVVGSLMEQNFNCPVVTIEAGGSTDPNAHDVTLAGLQTLLSNPWLTTDNPSLSLYHHPVRVCLQPGLSLSYGESFNRDASLTLRADIEVLNGSLSPTGTLIGWCDRPVAALLSAINEQRQEVISSLFHVQDNRLQTRLPMQLFMATPRADIALSDCLFYAA